MSYTPSPPVEPYGASPDPVSPQMGLPPAPGQKRRWWPYVVLAASVVFAMSAAAYAYNQNLIFKDSGIAACEELAADGNKGLTGGKSTTDETMTEAQYRELRKVFAESRYDDIKDHGTKLIDVIWQVSQTTKGGDDAAMGALAYLGPLTTHMSGLQSACADQGIIVNLQPAANPSPTASPTASDPDVVEEGELGIEACDDLLPPSKTVTADPSVTECTGADGSILSVTAMECTDGRRLFQTTPAGKLDATGWGFAGERFHRVEGDPTKDDAYLKANTKCFS